VWRTAKQRKQTCLQPPTVETGSVDWEGCGVPQNGGNRLVLWSKQGPGDREGCGVAQNVTPRGIVHPPSTSTSLHGVLFIHRRPPLASAGYYSSTVDLLQPPRGPVHPPPTGCLGVGYRDTASLRGPVHPAPTAYAASGSCSSNPHRLGWGVHMSGRQQWEGLDRSMQVSTRVYVYRVRSSNGHCSSKGNPTG
jgi:hypothetical protein